MRNGRRYAGSGRALGSSLADRQSPSTAAPGDAIAIAVGASAGTPSPTARDEFWYDPDGDRFVKKATWTDGGSLKASYTVYLQGGAFEEVTPDHDPNVEY